MRIVYVAATVAMVSALPAYAERPEDKIWVQGGGFRANIDTFAQVDNQKMGLPGTPIDFEKDLGLRNRGWLPKIAGGVRLGHKLRAEADYFSLSRHGSATLSNLLGVDQTVFPVGAEVDTDFSTKIWRIALGWSPVLTEKAEFGMALGVHLTDAKFRLEADVPIGGVMTSLVEQQKAVIPLPNVSLYGNYNLNKTFGLHAKVDLLSLKVKDYKGKLVDAQLGIGARVQKNIGVGIAYRYVRYNLEARTGDWHGNLKYRYHGPLAFVEVAF